MIKPILKKIKNIQEIHKSGRLKAILPEALT